jgi:hypothetical protein
MSKTLTQHQINLIKQTIAVYDNVFVSMVSDQDVWDFVEDRAMMNKISFEDAAYGSYDDFDVAKAMGLDY